MEITDTSELFRLCVRELGRKEDQFIMPEEQDTVTFQNNRYDTNKKITLRKVLIDGFGVGDVGTTVLRDRRVLAEDGMFSVVLLVDTTRGILIKEPVLLSRGFVFAKENQQLLDVLKKKLLLNSRNLLVSQSMSSLSAKKFKLILKKVYSNIPVANPWFYHF